MVNLGVQIVRFVMEQQPPIVEAEFLDSEGRRQTFVDKVAIFTSDWPDADSHYPQFGVMRCHPSAAAKQRFSKTQPNLTRLGVHHQQSCTLFNRNLTIQEPSKLYYYDG